jgi:hypothetical protein
MILIIMKVFTRYDSFLLISSLFRFSTAIRLLKNERPSFQGMYIYAAARIAAARDRRARVLF